MNIIRLRCTFTPFMIDARSPSNTITYWMGDRFNRCDRSLLLGEDMQASHTIKVIDLKSGTPVLIIGPYTDALLLSYYYPVSSNGVDMAFHGFKPGKYQLVFFVTDAEGITYETGVDPRICSEDLDLIR